MEDLNNKLTKLENILMKKNYNSLWFSINKGNLKKINKLSKLDNTIVNIKTSIKKETSNPVNINVEFYNQHGGTLTKIHNKCKNITYSIDEIKKTNYKLDLGLINRFSRLVHNNLLKDNTYNISSIKSNKLIPISGFTQLGGNENIAEIKSISVNYGVLPGISKIKGAGSGMFAIKDFNVGDIVEVAPVLPVPFKDITNNILKDYVFMYDGSNYGLVLAYGSMYNHQNNHNLKYHYTNNKKFMVYKASKNIKAGNELFVNYGSLWWIKRNLTPIDIEQ